MEDIKGTLPDCSEGICKPQKFDDIDIDAVVSEIIKRLQNS